MYMLPEERRKEAERCMKDGREEIERDWASNPTIALHSFRDAIGLLAEEDSLFEESLDAYFSTLGDYIETPKFCMQLCRNTLYISPTALGYGAEIKSEKFYSRILTDVLEQINIEDLKKNGMSTAITDYTDLCQEILSFCSPSYEKAERLSDLTVMALDQIESVEKRARQYADYAYDTLDAHRNNFQKMLLGFDRTLENEIDVADRMYLLFEQWPSKFETAPEKEFARYILQKAQQNISALDVAMHNATRPGAAKRPAGCTLENG